MSYLLAAVLLTGPSPMTVKAHRAHGTPWHQARASVYSDPQPVAAGGRLDVCALTCAHRTFRFGTRVELARGDRRVVVTCNDRGPFVRGREFDLTPAAAARLGFTEHGAGVVTLRWRLVPNGRMAR